MDGQLTTGGAGGALALRLSDHPFPQTSLLPRMPSQVLTRATTHLRMVKQGLRDMEDPDQDRVVLGFFGITVFGRSVTSALQNLRTFDKQAFDEWYEPWKQEMKDDPLCRFFYQLRTEILKDIGPMVGFVLASFGDSAKKVGTLIIQDRPLPTLHRGQPINDTSTQHLCSLYVAYLEEMVNSASSVIFAVEDRWLLSQRG